MILSMEWECECERKTLFDVKPLGTLQIVFQDVRCEGCLALWEFRFRKHWSGKIAATHRLKQGSRKLADVLEKRKLDKIRNVPQKKAPQIFQK